MSGMVMKRKLSVCGGGKELRTTNGTEEDQEVSLVTLLVSAIRKSMVSSCRFENGDKKDQGLSSASAFQDMEIGWPTNVQHLTHVTFDRFNGFLGLPAEFEVEVPSKVPSARFIFFFLIINFLCLS